METEIFKYWTNFADGFTSYGALFLYSENGGKKIHKNDTIEPNKQYYWLIPKGNFQAKSGVNYKLISSLSIDRKEFEIYTITIKHNNEVV